MPVSSLEMATTGTLYLATSGRMASSFSSSPVTELTSGRPLAVSSPTFSAAGTEESMQSGMSTSDCTISSVWLQQRRLGLVGIDRRHAGIDVEDMGAGRDLGQRVLDDRLEIAGLISAASFLRPVGLMRSPMMVNGRSKPMITCLFSDATSV